jgi:hypothetical protein
MPAPTAFPAKGKVLRIEGDTVVFQPANTNYELHLKGTFPEGRLNTPVHLLIRATGRKLMTVPSGGNFLTPIMGTPRIAQGRILHADNSTVILQAACPVHVTLPQSEEAIDLPDGAITTGELLNATLLPGASFELVNP